MKTIRLYTTWCLVAALLTACSKDNEELPDGPDPDNGNGEQIEPYERTGNTRGFLKTDQYVFLYGESREEGRATFPWMAWYDAAGELQQEFAEKVGAKDAWIIGMTPLADGKFMLHTCCGTYGGLYPEATCQVPILLDTQTKQLKQIEVGEGFFFDQVDVYPDFWLLYPTNRTLLSTPQATPWLVQLDTEGNLLLETHSYRLPAAGDSVRWINRTDYVAAGFNRIAYTNLDGNQAERWSQEVEVIGLRDIALDVSDGQATAIYRYVDIEDTNRSRTRIYRLGLESGKMQTVADSIVVAAPDEVVLSPGQQVELNARLMPADCYFTGIGYYSSDAAVATVSESGVLSAGTSGRCRVYIDSEDGFARRQLAVRVVTFGIDKENVVIKEGNTLKLNLVSEKKPDGPLKWTSSNEEVVTVDADGNVTAVGRGMASIRVTSADSSQTAFCFVTVVNPLDGFGLKQDLDYEGTALSGKMHLGLTLSNRNASDILIRSVELRYRRTPVDEEPLGGLPLTLCTNHRLTADGMFELELDTEIAPYLSPYLAVCFEADGKPYVYEEEVLFE